jgi:hypothetical protein
MILVLQRLEKALPDRKPAYSRRPGSNFHLRAPSSVGRRFTAISPPPDCMLQYICLARAIEVSPIVPGRYRNDVKSARQANSIQLFCDSAR